MITRCTSGRHPLFALHQLGEEQRVVDDENLGLLHFPPRFKKKALLIMGAMDMRAKI